MDTLARILAVKSEEVRLRRAQKPLEALQAEAAQAPATRGFTEALTAQARTGRAAVIAEIKKASPSKGLLRPDFAPAAIARAYAEAGATCLSVLTDVTFFQGADEDLKAARAAVSLPVLRKDFVVAAYQLYEARVLGADAVLLIVAALTDADLRAFLELAATLGLDALVEVHDRTELERAVAAGARLIGVNNRDLRTFVTRLENTLELLPDVPLDRVLVSESGILDCPDVALLWAAGLRAFLVGEAFMRAEDPGLRLRALFEGYL